MKAMLFFALALVLAVPALGQTVSVVQDNVGNNETVYYFHQRNVARATDGTLMVVWINIKSNTAGGQVQYSTYDPAFQTWSPPAAVSSAGDRARQPALAADGNGAIHAVWMQRDASGDKYQEYYAKYEAISKILDEKPRRVAGIIEREATGSSSCRYTGKSNCR